MARRLMRRFFLSLAAVLALASSSELFGQSSNQPGGDDSAAGLREEVEPGVVVFGKPHRFAEIGNCQSFDSSPDGRTLVFATGPLKFFDLIENKVVEQISESGEYYQSVAYSPDGRLVFTHFYQGGGPDQVAGTIVRVFDAIDGSSISRISTAVAEAETNTYFHVQQMTVSADAKYIGLQSHNAVQVRDVDSGKLIFSLADQSYVQGIAFSSNEQELFVSSGGKIKVYEIDSGEELKRSDFQLANRTGNFISTNLARDLVAVCANNRVMLYGGDGKPQGSIGLPSGSYPQRVGFSDDGSRISIAAWEQQESGIRKMAVHIADVDHKRLIKQVGISSQGLTKMMFAADNQSLFVTGHGIFGALEVRLDEESSPAESKYPLGPMTMAAIHPDNQSFVTGTNSGELSWFDVDTGEVKQSIQHPNANSLTVTENGSGLVVGRSYFNSQPISRLSYRTGKPKKTYSVETVPKGSVFRQLRSFIVSGRPSYEINHVQTMPLSIRPSSDGTEINALLMELRYDRVDDGTLSGSTYEQKVFLKCLKLDSKTGKQLASSRFQAGQFGFKQNEWIQAGSLHPDGSKFAVVRQNKLKIIDSQTGEVVDELVTDGYGNGKPFDFSPTGEFIHFASGQALTVWDTESAEQVFRVESSQGNPVIAYSKDGSRLACCYNGKTSDVIIYNTRSWSEALKRNKTVANRASLAFSPDGSKLLIGLNDCRMELWDLAVLPR